MQQDLNGLANYPFTGEKRVVTDEDRKVIRTTGMDHEILELKKVIEVYCCSEIHFVSWKCAAIENCA